MTPLACVWGSKVVLLGSVGPGGLPVGANAHCRGPAFGSSVKAVFAPVQES